MKKPELKRPRLKESSLKAPKAPQFLKDLHADLRDRHLLLPMVGLIVAIAAVPFLLGGSSEEPIAAPAPVGVDADANQLESAVLAEQTGIRSYRKRLAALRRQNPFDQQYTGAKAGQETEVAVDDGSAAVSVAGEGSEPVDSGSSPSVSTQSSTPVPSSSSSDPSVSVGGGPPEPDATSHEGVAEQTGFYTGTVDVSFGVLGDAKRHKNVTRFTNLPSDSNPVVAFLGLSVDSDRAYFLVSPEVTRMDGDGACLGKDTGCQFLELAIGAQQSLTVGETEPQAPRASANAPAVGTDTQAAPAPAESQSSERAGNSVTYRLKLLDTKIVEITDPRDE